jgi:hypothetical protein
LRDAAERQRPELHGDTAEPLAGVARPRERTCAVGENTNPTIDKAWPYKIPVIALVVSIFFTLSGVALLLGAFHFAVPERALGVVRWAGVLFASGWFAFGVWQLWEWMQTPPLRIALTADGVILPRDWRSKTEEFVAYKDIKTTAFVAVEAAGLKEINHFLLLCSTGEFRIWVAKMPSEQAFFEVCQSIEERIKKAAGPPDEPPGLPTPSPRP